MLLKGLQHVEPDSYIDNLFYCSYRALSAAFS